MQEKRLSDVKDFLGVWMVIKVIKTHQGPLAQGYKIQWRFPWANLQPHPRSHKVINMWASPGGMSPCYPTCRSGRATDEVASIFFSSAKLSCVRGGGDRLGTRNRAERPCAPLCASARPCRLSCQTISSAGREERVSPGPEAAVSGWFMKGYVDLKQRIKISQYVWVLS